MGNRLSVSKEVATYPDAPRFRHVPVYDPNYGFDRPRPERVMVATREEMESAKVPLADRNYCAHKRLAYLACRRDNLPFHKHKCHHQHHEYADCEFEDWVIRMKDFERERRLAQRKRRIDGVQGA